MNYWIVFKIKNHKFLYVDGTDEYGYPTHIEDESQAWKFYDFNVAMSYITMGYVVQKCYQ